MQIKSNSILTQSLLILFLSTITALIFNSISHTGIPVIYSPPLLTGGGEIDAEQARTLYLGSNALFIDTRYPEEFARGHIPGAVNVPQKWSLDQVMVFFESIPRDRLLVIYCGSSECNSSRRLAGFLNQIEYTGVLIFIDGFEVWKVNNYPIELLAEEVKSAE
jgi:rhodanese-related sulfurtransferase